MLSGDDSLAYTPLPPAAHMRRSTLPPRLLLFLPRPVAGPEQRFVPWMSIAEAVAAVAAAGAAKQALLRGPLQPARQRRAVGRVVFHGPAFQDRPSFLRRKATFK